MRAPVAFTGPRLTSAPLPAKARLMLQPLFRAVAQLNDPVFIGVVWRSLALSLLAFVAILAGSAWLVEDWASGGGWLGWVLGALGGLGVIALAVWLFVPVALLIATFYVDRIASA